MKCQFFWRRNNKNQGVDCYILFLCFTEFLILSIKPQPNDRNMPMQHVATLLGATCCVHLATMLRIVATCWVLLAQIWPFSNLSQQHPTCCNTSQHGGQTHATCWAQQCCDMLRWYVAIIWPGLNNCQVSYCMLFLCFIRLFCFTLLTWYFFHPLSKLKLFLKRMVSCLECLCCDPFFWMFTTCIQCIWWIKHLFCLTC